MVISWPRLSAVTHITSCPKREVHIATARAGPVIFPAATYKRNNLKYISNKANITRKLVSSWQLQSNTKEKMDITRV